MLPQQALRNSDIRFEVVFLSLIWESLLSWALVFAALITGAGVCYVTSDSLQPYGLCSPPGSSVHGILQARILEWVACPPPGDLPDPGIKPTSLMSLELAGGFFTTGTTWDALIAEVLVMVEMTKVENVGKRKKRNESQS